MTYAVPSLPQRKSCSMLWRTAMLPIHLHYAGATLSSSTALPELAPRGVQVNCTGSLW